LFNIRPHDFTSLVVSRLVNTAIFFLAVSSLVAAESSAATQTPGLGLESAKELGILITHTIVSLLIGAVLGLIFGAVGGLYLWRWLRDKGWLDVSWGWYKYVRWIWPVLIVGCLSLGMSGSVGTWGAGWKMKKELREGQLIKATLESSYAAIMAWREDGNVTDANSTSQLDRDLGVGIGKMEELLTYAKEMESEKIDQFTMELEKKSGGTWYEKWLIRKLVEVLWEDQIKGNLADNEAVDILQNTAEIKKTSGQDAAIGEMKGTLTHGIYLVFEELIATFVWSTILTVMALALGIPLLPLSVFWLIRWLWLRKHSGEKIASEDPPLLDA
jgi:hypothetical protein